jgi:hypothetical protein
MPKEIIDTHRGTKEHPEPRVILKWDKESGDAQLGVEFHEYFVFNKDSHLLDQPTFNSLWFTFESRRDFNNMIRILRKMRDQTCGKDE